MVDRLNRTGSVCSSPVRQAILFLERFRPTLLWLYRGTPPGGVLGRKILMFNDLHLLLPCKFVISNGL